ncbi:MAG: eight-cysteine-cluster domain-containing protein [Candidatus Woesearchaeota archaeon]
MAVMILMGVMLLVSCNTKGFVDGADDFCGRSTMAECSSDSDCKADGCSGQVCMGAGEEQVVTTCEFRECYDNEEYGLDCGCVEGKCKWA